MSEQTQTKNIENKSQINLVSPEDLTTPAVLEPKECIEVPLDEGYEISLTLGDDRKNIELKVVPGDQCYMIDIKGQQIKIPEVNRDVDGPLIIGRINPEMISLLPPTVSREHCEIFTDNNYIIIGNTDPSNTTTVASKKELIEEPTPLRSPDTLKAIRHNPASKDSKTIEDVVLKRKLSIDEINSLSGSLEDANSEKYAAKKQYLLEAIENGVFQLANMADIDPSAEPETLYKHPDPRASNEEPQTIYWDQAELESLDQFTAVQDIIRDNG